MNLKQRIRRWFLDTFGDRVSRKFYIGHGDFTEEFGWELFGRFFPEQDGE